MSIETPQYSTPPGWYPDHGNPLVERWWDGSVWTTHSRTREVVPMQMPAPVPAAQAVAHTSGPMLHSQLNVRREVVYNREQKGHSVVVHSILALFTAGISLIWTIYYAASPNHYFHT